MTWTSMVSSKNVDKGFDRVVKVTLLALVQLLLYTG